MTEYIIDVDIDKARFSDDGTKIQLVPTVLREIVRCRDCKYYKPDPNPIDPGWPMWCEDTGRDMLEPYGFCAWGERSKNDER